MFPIPSHIPPWIYVHLSFSHSILSCSNPPLGPVSSINPYNPMQCRLCWPVVLNPGFDFLNPLGSRLIPPVLPPLSPQLPKVDSDPGSLGLDFSGLCTQQSQPTPSIFSRQPHGKWYKAILNPWNIRQSFNNSTF